MRFDDLKRALSAELATESVGVPVSIRVHLSWPDPQCDLAAILESLIAMASTTFGCAVDRTTANENGDGRQLTALCRFEKGQTAVITLTRGCGPEKTLLFLVVGNRGMIRLEGGELLEDLPAGS
jgi:hypothetical protein